MNITHISTECNFRSPQAALKTEQNVTLRIQIADAEVCAVSLRIYIGNQESLYEMKRAGQNLWEIVWQVPATPCVCWYSFVVESKEGKYYYGPHLGKTQGEGQIYQEPCFSFQMTVYDRQFQTPDWFRGCTMYQIFPDRFCQGNPKNLKKGTAYHEKMGRRIVLHERWGETPLFQPLAGEKYYAPCDFYGGDLKGIQDSLPYLKSLGVDVLYLNPIVESASNHRYDAADYKKVDPILGSNEDFTELCKEARKHGIRILLDGVYSHTGSDSRYFNKKSNYKEPGAYQGESSPYYKWYTFKGGKDSYKCWWDFDTLPEVNELDQSWQEFVITGKQSVFKHWLNLGASGFRLDVADELPDEVISLMRSVLKRQGKDKVLLGEVWEDATTKQSYGKNREYALGTGLDSVMNYPFKNACLDFLLQKKTAFELENFLVSQMVNYPKPMYYSLMNLLSSHDVPRIRTILSTGLDGEGMTREEQSSIRITPEQEKRGSTLFKLAALLQFVIPGVPSVYYGDEYGMNGLKDPFNRGPFTKRDIHTFHFFQKLGLLRKLETFKRGSACFLALSDDVIAILRFCLHQKDAFGLKADNSVVLTLINRQDQEYSGEIDFKKFTAGLQKEEIAALSSQKILHAIEWQKKNSVPVVNGKFTAKVPAEDYVIYRFTPCE